MSLGALVRRDLQLALGRPAALGLPAVFFLMVAAVLPFAVGPDARLLARLAPGLLWLAALLASLLPVAELYAGDEADGTLDQYRARGVGSGALAAARTLASWVALALPLLLALPAAALLLGLPAAAWGKLALGLAAGSLGLAALGNLAAALTLGARGGVAGLLALPLAVPLLVFGAALGDPDGAAALKLLAAQALALAAVCPWAAGWALDAARG